MSKILPVNPESIPIQLKDLRQWIMWRLVKKEGDKKPTKLPYNPQADQFAKTNDTTTWNDFDTCYNAYINKRKNYSGLGICVCENDNLTLIDIDDCVNEKGELNEIAKYVLALFENKTFADYSPSGKGIHIYCYGKAIRSGKGTIDKCVEVYAYPSNRYLTVTGNALPNIPNAITLCQDALNSLHDAFLAEKPSYGEPINHKASHDKLVDTLQKIEKKPVKPNESDDSIFEKIRNSKNGEKFKKLWDGDTSGYHSQSEADLALCDHLAYWFKNDSAKVDSLFRKSGLYRDKWDRKHHANGETYGQATIYKVLKSAETEQIGKLQIRNDDGGDTSDTRTGDDDESKSQKQTKSSQLLRLVENLRFNFYHTSNDKGIARFVVNAHVETSFIRIKYFKDYLRGKYFERYQAAVNDLTMQEVINTLDAKAQFEGKQVDIFTRVAKVDGKIYLDLCNERWQCVEISKEGYQVIPIPETVFFIRHKDALPLPSPEANGRLDDLRQLVNVKNESDLILTASWLIGAMIPDIPYPILSLTGSQGAGKSNCSKLLKQLIDNNNLLIRKLPHSENDLAIGCVYNHVIVYDNLSRITDCTSDMLCNVSTGGGIASRELYTNDGEITLKFRKPLILNGINQVAYRHDLLDRMINIELEAIPEDKRLTESQLAEKITKYHASILGGLCKAVSAGLRNYDRIPVDKLPRMADFSKWIIACESACFWEKGDFMKAYDENRNTIVDDTLDGDIVVTALLEFMSGKDNWEGSASELLKDLSLMAGEPITKLKEFPKKPESLVKKLKRIQEFLKGKIDIIFNRNYRERVIQLTANTN